MQHSTYWLSRTPGTQPEGPYFFDQLERMFASGHVTAQAQICPQGGKEWRLLAAAIRNPSSKPVDTTARNCEVSLYVLIFLAGVVSIVPIFGLVFGLVAYGVILLVGTALAVVMMVKGKTARGIFGLGSVWLGLPILIFLAQSFGLGIGVGMSKYQQRKAKETALAESADRQQFEERCREEAKAVMVRSGWSAEGVKFSVPISSKENEPVVYAELPKNQGADVWRFDFRTDGTVDKIISTKRGELYRQAEPADPTEAMRRWLDGKNAADTPSE